MERDEDGEEEEEVLFRAEPVLVSAYGTKSFIIKELFKGFAVIGKHSTSWWCDSLVRDTVKLIIFQ